MYAKKVLEDFQKQINPLINEYFDKKILEAEKIYPQTALEALKVYRDVTTRGAKRARAAFAYMTYKMYGGTNLDEALKMGIVLELVHSYLLILDDFMDDSNIRRGDPTAHIMFKDYAKKHNFQSMDKSHFGESLAVTIAAAGFHMAMQILNELKFNDDVIERLSQNLNQKIEITAYGQIIDVANAASQNSSEEDVLKMLEWKTGVYTYENPIHIGAIMAGADSPKELKALSEYAIPAGIAFQIQDDILGVFGKEEELGKSVKSDIAEGKYTLLVNYALEKGDSVQQEFLRSMLGNKSISDKELEQVRDIFISTKALERSREKAHELVLKAKGSLVKNHNPIWKSEGLDYLNGIAEYMIERKL